MQCCILAVLSLKACSSEKKTDLSNIAIVLWTLQPLDSKALLASRSPVQVHPTKVKLHV